MKEEVKEIVKKLKPKQRKLILYLLGNVFEFKCVVEKGIRTKRIIEELIDLGIIKEVEAEVDFSKKSILAYTLTDFGFDIAKYLADLEDKKRYKKWLESIGLK